MKPISIVQPKLLKFGNYSTNELADHLNKLNLKKAFIVADKIILNNIQNILSDLKSKNIDFKIYDEIKAEPSTSDLIATINNANTFKPDVVIGIGGGSVLDVAKLVAALYKNTQSVEDVFGINNLNGRKTYLVCIPTTSGTGSEVSPNSILIDINSNTKKGAVSPYLVPDASIIDPVLTITVPKSVTAVTGIDALIHCIEAYANKYSHPLVDYYALKGITLITSNLLNAYNDGNNLEARTSVSLGSMFGGICLGPVNTAGIHALAYPLGSKYKLSHGLSTALLLPHVLQFNINSATDRYANIAVAMGLEKNTNDLTTAKNGIEYLNNLFTQLNIPKASTIANPTEKDIQEMAEYAITVTRLLKNNVREITLQNAINIFNDLFSK